MLVPFREMLKDAYLNDCAVGAFTLMAPIFWEAARKATVPVAVHLDHGQSISFESLRRFPGIEEDVPAEYLLSNEYVFYEYA